MTKVFDALQRAEEERRRRAGEDVSAVAPAQVDTTAAPPRTRKSSIWKRVFQRRRRRIAGSGSSEINKRRVALIQPDSYVAEQFRGLRGRIDAIAAENPITTLVVTSAFPGEGKTTASVNLAAVTALSLGRRVLLIDCDLRKPKVHETLGLQPQAGLAEVLRGETTLEDAVMTVEGASFEVLAVRSRPTNPSELLGSVAMQQLIERAAQQYDRVILDSPAAAGLPDAKVISDLSEGIVMVVRADMTAEQDVQGVLDILGRERVLGMVLNGAALDQARYGYATN
jgi:capsular exopolysaccharide synthesis family protein